ncbi:XRE family transcriptional regulator [Ligilactobacillus animalis]|uniref:XRE family transcriptional regulator n=1 Tax=Ligilactobacillus animalis TaxID=1605 RepID=UPI003EB90E4D
MPEVNLKLIKQRRTELGLTQAMMAKELNLAFAEKYARRENGVYKFQNSRITDFSKNFKDTYGKNLLLVLRKSNTKENGNVQFRTS